MPLAIEGAIKIRQIIVEAATGKLVPANDTRFYDAPCLYCGPQTYVSRYKGQFLCLGCIDEKETR